MKRTQWVLIAVIVGVAALVLILATRTRQAPYLPSDRDHAVFDSAEACLSCHQAGGEHPRGPNHPPARECMRCHGRR